MTRTIFLVLFLIITSFSVQAQREIIEETDRTVELAIADLDELMTDEKFLQKLEKEDVHGDYTYKITVDDKGRISSMRALERSENASIHGQNFLNDLVRKHKFDFRIPRGVSHQFEYTFKTP